MPRTARTISRSNIYHVMMRGVNRQNIFEDDEDRLCFMSLLARCKKISGFKLYAFVLMSNHVHLLIEPAGESMEIIFRRLGSHYVGWYNRKYERVGHLFQDRFRSENVEDDLYFRTVLRYIMQNPMKAGLESRPGSYRWSSYFAYEKGKGSVTDTQFALEMFGGREALLAYLGQENEDTVLDEDSFDRQRRNEAAQEAMTRITGCASGSDFQQLEKTLQKEYMFRMYRAGLSLGQIARFTCVSKATVYTRVKAMAELNESEEELVLREEDEPILYDLDEGTIW